VKLLYTGPSENRFSLNTGQFFKFPPNNSLQKKSHKTGHPSKLAIFLGPSAGRFREVSLHSETSHHWPLKKNKPSLNIGQFL
jgi:hypothetical protein